MMSDNNQQVFFALIRAGLFPVHGEGFMDNESLLRDVDWEKVYQLAEEQSVVGLVLAGIEHSYVKPPQDLLLQWIGEVQIIEQQNKAMNDFIAKLIEKLRNVDVYAILVKGQGIAQCYEKPMWRSSGDVDLLLSEDNYQKAKKVLIPLADDVEKEFKSLKHLGMTIKGGFVVELHGTLHSRLSSKVDRVVDEVQNDVFCGGNVRSWNNNGTAVFLPAPDNDVIFVFTHILHHFYIAGIGLRQVCDWCRLLWTFKDSLNQGLLESRIRKMGLMSEWKAFAALAVGYLGMPAYAMPLYSSDKKWSKKAEIIMAFVLEVGNFGHNRSKSVSENYVSRKTVSLWNKAKDFGRHAMIFPLDSLKFLFYFIGEGIGNAMRGE